MDASEFYARTAELVAVLLPQAWRGLGPAVGAVLRGLDPDSGPVVDVGAGSGAGGRVAARAWPAAEIVAVEPDPALRTALMAMVNAEPDLRERVTVLGCDLAEAVLPERVGAVLLMNVLGHFDAGERLAVWDLLAARLAPTGPALLTLYPPTVPQLVPSTPMAEVTIGRRRYLGSAKAEPSGPDTVDWETSYQVLDGDTTITEFSARDRWVVVTPEQIAAELEPRGLTITEVDPDQFLHVVTRSSHAVDDQLAGRGTAKALDRHYGLPARGAAILEAVEEAGHDPRSFEHSVLERVEEFHSMGRRGTVELAERAGVAAGELVLDVGCGIGGPARYLAGTLGARVTGIDLTAEFCAIARELNARTGFGDTVDIHHGDALALPFPDAGFDVVWSQHTAMNIADKPALYRELRRVTRPGGRMAFFDIVGGDGRRLHFPVVWADSRALSHLIATEELRDVVEHSGFTITSWEDLTDELTAAFDRQRRSGPPPPSPVPVELLVPDFATKSANVARNITEGRARVVRCVAVAR